MKNNVFKINLMKDVQGIYTENYKTLQREIRANLNKYIMSTGFKDSIIQTANISKLICGFNASPIQILRLLKRNQQLILKFA